MSFATEHNRESVLSIERIQPRGSDPLYGPLLYYELIELILSAQMLIVAMLKNVTVFSQVRSILFQACLEN